MIIMKKALCELWRMGRACKSGRDKIHKKPAWVPFQLKQKHNKRVKKVLFGDRRSSVLLRPFLDFFLSHPFVILIDWLDWLPLLWSIQMFCLFCEDSVQLPPLAKIANIKKGGDDDDHDVAWLGRWKEQTVKTDGLWSFQRAQRKGRAEKWGEQSDIFDKVLVCSETIACNGCDKNCKLRSLPSWHVFRHDRRHSLLDPCDRLFVTSCRILKDGERPEWMENSVFEKATSLWVKIFDSI